MPTHARPASPIALRIGRRLRNAGVLAEAFVALAAASAAIRWLPFARVMAVAGWTGARTAPRDPGAAAHRVCWAVERWADLVPWRAVCFQRGLALQWMLRRRGIAGFLHYGIDGRAAGGISAHVWIELDGRALLGGAEAAHHARVMVRPDPAAPRR